MSTGAQWLYMFLLTSPTLTYAGISDWRPARIAAKVDGVDADEIRRRAAELEAGRFAYVDESTEEVVIRSFLRHDGLLLNPNLWRSVSIDFADIASGRLQSVVAVEAKRLRDEHPDGFTTSKGGNVNPWASKHLATMLGTPSEPPTETPQGTPSDTPTQTPSPEVVGRGYPTTTTTATATSSKEDRSTANRGTRISERFKITDEMRAWGAEHVPLLDLDKQLPEFIDYWIGVPGAKGVKRDWVSTWRNGMRTKQKFAERDNLNAPVRKVKKFNDDLTS